MLRSLRFCYDCPDFRQQKLLMSLRRQGTFEMSAPEVMIADVEPDTVLFHRDSEYEVIERSSVFEVFCYSLCVLA